MLVFVLVLSALLLIPQPVYADAGDWDWSAGDACAWTQGCTNNYVYLPTRVETQIEIPSECNYGILQLTRPTIGETIAVEVQLDDEVVETIPLVYSTTVAVLQINNSNLSLRNVGPVDAELTNVHLTCETTDGVPPIEMLSAMPIDFKPTAFSQIESFGFWEVWEIGRWALTTWNMVRDAGLSYGVVVVLVILPVVVITFFKLMKKPPDF